MPAKSPVDKATVSGIGNNQATTFPYDVYFKAFRPVRLSKFKVKVLVRILGRIDLVLTFMNNHYAVIWKALGEVVVNLFDPFGPITIAITGNRV
ncbi:hypothetical protein [Salinisphaera sp.]|uniref:hypothetical protein n=1 Tax=Salinisphaera sp. TaxID=1914330 RepID=UPI003C7A516D